MKNPITLGQTRYFLLGSRIFKISSGRQILKTFIRIKKKKKNPKNCSPFHHEIEPLLSPTPRSLEKALPSKEKPRSLQMPGFS